MNRPPASPRKHPTYENFEAECPHCGEWCIFNRASDLGTFGLIAGRDVTCQNAACGQPFRIGGDMISTAPEMLLFDCYGEASSSTSTS